jgi:hypothetical protein
VASPVDLGTIPVYRDADWSWQIQNNGPTGSPIDMTAFGTVWTSMARTNLAAADAVTITVDASQAATGLIVLSLTHAATAALAVTLLHFDVFAAASGGTPVNAVYTGELQVDGAYTHG